MGTELKKNNDLPIVVLAGRPNVGKSTLFNRLLHKRKAITSPIPGVTRDPIEADCYIVGKLLKLIDTGGFKLVDCDDMDKLVVKKTFDTIKRADIIILIFDASEVTGEDEEFIKRLRQYRNKLIAVVNKTEGGRKQADAWNFLSYGFDNILMISAEHGDNIGELEQEIIKKLDNLKINEGQSSVLGTELNSGQSSVLGTESSERQSSALRTKLNEGQSSNICIALLGKPNTGKSTLSNRLTSTNASIVSDIPGTTRDTIKGNFIWKNRDLVVFDTAGIRRKAKVTEDIEYYSVNRAIKAIGDANVVILMIDAVEGLTDQDKKIAALAHDQGRGIIMALNKWDTMPQQKNTLKISTDKIHFQFGQMEYAPIIPISSTNGKGVDKLLDTVIKVYDQLNINISTSHLNQKLEQWQIEYPPPSSPNKRFKLKYAVQKSVNPVHFIFFASRPQAVSEAYISYLRNKLRKDLGFSLIPVKIEIKGARK